MPLVLVAESLREMQSSGGAADGRWGGEALVLNGREFEDVLGALLECADAVASARGSKARGVARAAGLPSMRQVSRALCRARARLGARRPRATRLSARGGGGARAGPAAS
jgi:hypothetical protein